MAKTKTTAPPPLPKSYYKGEYDWAPDELLDECSLLNSVEDVEAHRGDPALYNFNAFHKNHDSQVLVSRVRPGMPVCADSRDTGGCPFFFLYQMVLKRVGLRLPLTPFEKELLTEINTAPAQLHPNSWAFVRGFQILCGYLGVPSSVDVFLHFFEVKKQGKSLWMSFSGIAGRIILTLFQNSFKGWKGKFFKVRATKRDPSILEGFPLYWTDKPITMKPLALDELAPPDRDVCKALAGLGIVFDTAKLIANEFNAHGLSTYFGICSW